MIRKSILHVNFTIRGKAPRTYIVGCTCETTYTSCPAMPLEDRNIALLDTINNIYEANGLNRLKIGSGTGGSDAAYTTLAGIPTIDDLSVAGEFLHSIKEYSSLSSLALSAKMLAAVAYCI